MAVTFSGTKRRSSGKPDAPALAPVPRDPLAEAEALAAQLTAQADEHRAALAQIATQRAVLARRLAPLRALKQELEHERERHQQVIADSTTLRDLGIAGVDAQIGTAQERVAALSEQLATLDADVRGLETIETDLARRALHLEDQERAAREQATSALQTVLTAEKQRLVQKVRRAHVAYVMACRDAGAFNACFKLERPEELNPTLAGRLLAIDRIADSLTPGGAQIDQLLHRQYEYSQYDVSWVDRLANEVGLTPEASDA